MYVSGYVDCKEDEEQILREEQTKRTEGTHALVKVTQY